MNATRNQAGFSLIELMVAMLVTMIVSGAIFTLLNAGQGAFRRQPELTDRQQNIRLAMDLIQRDVAVAGAGMDSWEQAFSAGDGPLEGAPLLDGFNNLGTGPSGRPWDVLETMGADNSCNDVPSGAAPINASTVTTAFNLPQCFPGQPGPSGPNSGLSAIRFTTPVATPRGPDSVFWGLSGPNTSQNVRFNGPQPVKSDVAINGAAINGQLAASVVTIQIARYQILVDGQGVPNLWRSGRGGLNQAGALTLVGDPAGGWQLIARGIEDLQVRYRPAGGAFADSPPVAAVGAFNTLVEEAEVTLWARTFAPDLQGQTAPNGQPPAVRGSLTTVTAARAALQALTDPAAGILRYR